MAYSASAEDIEVPQFEEDSEEAYYGPSFNADEFYDDEYEEESIGLIEGRPQGLDSPANPQLIEPIVSDYTHVCPLIPCRSRKDASQCNWMVEPKRTYIPIDQIKSLPTLASQCPSLTGTLGVDAMPPRVEGQDAVPPRFVEATGQTVATAPVVCELCHKGLRCKEDVIDHCKCVHGDFAEYRKHVLWKAQQYGLHRQPWWQKKQKQFEVLQKEQNATMISKKQNAERVRRHYSWATIP